MKNFAIDENNDLFLTRGSITLNYDIEAVSDICKEVAQTVLGELALNEDLGIPYHELIWSSDPNISQIENALREAFLSVNGVTRVSSLSAFVKDGTLSYNATIQTIYGETTIV